jgi:hypothetical protein
LPIATRKSATSFAVGGAGGATDAVALATTLGALDADAVATTVDDAAALLEPATCDEDVDGLEHAHTKPIETT